MMWNKDVTQLDALEAALAVLRQIPMKHMRQGSLKYHIRLHLLNLNLIGLITQVFVASFGPSI